MNTDAAMAVSWVEALTYGVGVIIAVIVFYYIIRAAVKYGIIAAFDKMSVIKVITKTEAEGGQKNVRGTQKHMWKCPNCSAMNPPDTHICEKCKHDFGLVGLRDAGILSEEEFQAKKQDLLSKM
jgi:hypothetical protein